MTRTTNGALRHVYGSILPTAMQMAFHYLQHVLLEGYAERCAGYLSLVVVKHASQMQPSTTPVKVIRQAATHTELQYGRDPCCPPFSFELFFLCEMPKAGHAKHDARDPLSGDIL